MQEGVISFKFQFISAEALSFLPSSITSFRYFCTLKSDYRTEDNILRFCATPPRAYVHSSIYTRKSALCEIFTIRDFYSPHCTWVQVHITILSRRFRKTVVCLDGKQIACCDWYCDEKIFTDSVRRFDMVFTRNTNTHHQMIYDR